MTPWTRGSLISNKIARLTTSRIASETRSVRLDMLILSFSTKRRHPWGRRLQRSLDLFDLECFQNVSLLNVVEVGDLDAAFESVANLASVVFMTLE